MVEPVRILMLLVAVLLVSGCVMPFSPSVPGVAEGVRVVAFEPDFPSIYKGEAVDLRLKLKNAGSFEAGNIDLDLSGLEEWEVTGPSGSCKRFNLIPASAEYGTEGEEIACSWNVASPEVPPRLDVTYSTAATVYYDYVSKSVIRLVSLSRSELKRLQETGKSPTYVSTYSGRSPVTLQLSATSPVILSGDSFEFPLKIRVLNQGGGGLCKREKGADGNCMGTGKDAFDESKLNRVTLHISSENAKVLDCKEGEIVDLWNGREGAVTCRLSADGVSSVPTQIMVEVTAYYRYFTSSETSVRVLPRP